MSVSQMTAETSDRLTDQTGMDAIRRNRARECARLRVHRYREANRELVRERDRERKRKCRQNKWELILERDLERKPRCQALTRGQKSDVGRTARESEESNGETTTAKETMTTTRRPGLRIMAEAVVASVSTDGQESAGERFKCQLCRFEFKKEINLNKHYHNVHGVHITCDADNGLTRFLLIDSMKTMQSMSDCVKLEVQSCDANEDILNENISDLSRELGENFDYMSKVIVKTIKNKLNCDYNGCHEVKNKCNKLKDGIDLKCIDCKESFLDDNQLKQHVDQSHGRYYVCDWRGCQYRTEDNSNYIEHNKRHIFCTIIVCKFFNCDYSSEDNKEVLLHEKTAHIEEDLIQTVQSFTLKQNNNISLKCKVCEQTYSYSTDGAEQLKKHVNINHGGFYVCEWSGCEYRFLNEQLLTNHIKRRHKNQRDLSFPHCELLFNSETDLVRHTRVNHTHEREFKCDKCDKTYATLETLRAHVRNSHCDDIELRNNNEESKTEICDNNEGFVFEQILPKIEETLNEEIEENLETQSVTRSGSQLEKENSERFDYLTENKNNTQLLGDYISRLIDKNKSIITSLNEYNSESINNNNNSLENISNNTNNKGFIFEQIFPNIDDTLKEEIEENIETQSVTRSGTRVEQICGADGCDFRTSVMTELKSHHLECHPSLKLGPIKCDKCDNCFYTKYKLKLHVSIAHVEPSLACDWSGCRYRTRHPKSLKHHRMRHANERPHVCQWPDCGRRCVSKNALDKHTNSVHPDIVECLHCGKQLNENCLRDHIIRMHTDIRRYDCDACPRRFAVQSDLAIHEKMAHNRKSDKVFECNECEYKTKSKRSLYFHRQRIHLKKRNFRCDASDCGKRFFSKNELKRHSESVHSEARNYACHWPECKSAFKIKRNLMSHIKNKHMGRQKKIAD